MGDNWYRAPYRPVGINYDLEIVQKGLSDLQILDHIIGHADRNPGNWIYEKRNGRIVGVKGIDNDDAFGKNWVVKGPVADDKESKTPDVPPVVDIDTAISILSKDLRASKILERLDPQEIQATQARLQHVKDKIIERAMGGFIAALPRRPGDPDPAGKLEQLRVLVNGKSEPALKDLRTWGATVRNLHDEHNSYLGSQIAQAGPNNVNAAPDSDKDEVVLM